MLILSSVYFIFIHMNYGLIFTKHIKANDTEQRNKITQFASGQKIPVDKFISFDKNPDFSVFRPNDTIICYAWDCLCHTQDFLRKFIRYILTNGIFLYSTTSKYHIDKKTDADALRYAFDMYEDIRFNFVSRKNLQSAQTKIANGLAIGRPSGTKNASHVLDGKEATVLEMYKNRVSMYAIAKTVNVSVPTIKRFLIALNAIPKECLSKPGYPRGLKRAHHVMDGKENTAMKMHADGFSVSAIAREIGVSTPTVSKFLIAQERMYNNA